MRFLRMTSRAERDRLHLAAKQAAEDARRPREVWLAAEEAILRAEHPVVEAAGIARADLLRVAFERARRCA